MHRDAGEIKTSYFGRVVDAHNQRPNSPDVEVVADIEAEDGTLEPRSKRMLEERILEKRITMESIAQVYRMALRIAIDVLKDSVLQGRLLSPTRVQKEVIRITLLSISYQLRAEIVRLDMDTVAVMTQLGMSIELQEQDKDFAERLIDAVYDDAILSLLQTQTAERAAATIQ